MSTFEVLNKRGVSQSKAIIAANVDWIILADVIVASAWWQTFEESDSAESISREDGLCQMLKYSVKDKQFEIWY